MSLSVVLDLADLNVRAAQTRARLRGSRGLVPVLARKLRPDGVPDDAPMENGAGSLHSPRRALRASASSRFFVSVG